MSQTITYFPQINGLRPGDHLIVRFKEAAADKLRPILDLNLTGVLTLEPEVRTAITDIGTSQEWQRNGNRTLLLTAGSNWNQALFEHETEGLIEYVERERKN